MLFDSGTHQGPRPKCDFTVATLPAFVNHEQPSTKKKPFSTILSQTFSHTLEVLVPESASTLVHKALTDGVGNLRFARVFMKLGEVIDGDFFNQYVKAGNILMLSQGRPGHDHVFSLSDGVLHLEVDKATYERMGLEGKPIPSEGRKHVKARFAIDINLRLPSMVHGKKGFERVVWAFKHVLHKSLTWLFYDFKGPNDGTGPISAHQPFVYNLEADVMQFDGAIVPAFPTSDPPCDSVEAVELLEWIGMACSMSPRLQKDDRLDPYLCHYRNPENITAENDAPSGSVQNLVRLQWHGFIPSAFVTNIFLAVMKACGDDWFAMNAASFAGQAYTVLRTGNDTLVWEYAG